MDNFIEIYPVGTLVKMADIEAVITGMLIRGTIPHVQYECSWVTDKLNSEWVDEILVNPANGNKKVKIGFKPME